MIMQQDFQEAAVKAVRQWLASFEKALARSDSGALEGLFHPDGYWRDLLAFTWDIQTIKGAAAIAEALASEAPAVKISGVDIDPARTPPRFVVRAGQNVVEAIFAFRTVHGAGSGVLRLVVDEQGRVQPPPRAWTFLTSLADLDPQDASAGDATQPAKAYSRDFHGPNWLDDRRSAIAYADRDPEVLVVGAGQAGLSIAARLAQLNVDTLVVDQEHRIGDNWRKRYHALSLHNQVHVNHLPYMPFPPTFPTYIPKDKLAGWFESYADSMEINYWTDTGFSDATYDRQAGRWAVELDLKSGKSRTMHPRHIVMATGASGVANMPEIPGLDNFGGTVVHSSAYDNGADWSGRKVLVFGTGTSGHDIAQDLYSHGAEVTMVQRSPTMVLNVEPSAQLPYALYGEGPPLADCDLIAASMPFRLMRKSHQMLTDQIKNLDQDLLDGLSRIGFQLDFGWDESGWQFKYLERGGGYYFNVGCSDLLIDGKIGLVQFAEIEDFSSSGLRMRDGEALSADLIVLATGYKGQDYLVRRLFGDDVADRVGPIWGFDADQHELRNMFVRTGQPGLWFIAGSFAQCRIYSHYLGLQIKACEQGLIPLGR
jgi:hypothetical protein